MSGQARRHWPLAVVLLGFVASAFVVPTLAPTAWHDDWIYARSAELLGRHGRLEVGDLAAANAVFEALWGGLFVAILGFSQGVLRVSSVALAALAAPAVYLLALDLRRSRAIAAVAAAAFLFSPLAYVLQFSFMTDGHFIALEAIVVFLYARGCLREPVDTRYLLAGSAVSALAYLSRQQGALLVVAALTFLVVSGRIRWTRESVRLVLVTAGIPAGVVVAHLAWLRLANGVPSAQAIFWRDLRTVGATGSARLGAHLFMLEHMWVGLFALPLAVMLVVSAPAIARKVRWPALVLAGAWGALAVGIFIALDVPPTLFKAQSWFNTRELGPVAAAGQRAPFLPTWSETVLGVIGAGACAVLVVAVAARVMGPRPDRDRTLFLLSVLAWMAVGVLSGSFHFFPWGLDRYYLPLLVPAIGLAVVALPQPRRTTRLAALAAAPVLAACAVLAVGGTHDSLTVLSAVWRTADSAVYDLHIPERHVDGGAAWSGWNVGDTAVQLTSPEYAKTPVVGGRWWIQIFAPGIDGRYLVSVGQVVDGYDVVRARRCDLWLQTGGCTVYLLHQQGTPP